MTTTWLVDDSVDEDDSDGDVRPDFRSSEEAGPLFVPAFYEVVGRVLLCVRRGHLAGLGAVGESLDWWETLEGGLAVEWHGGPYAREVAVELISLANDPVTNGRLRPGSASWCPSERAQVLLEKAGWALLRVDGLEVQLRAMSPLGEDEAWRRRRRATRRPQPSPV